MNNENTWKILAFDPLEISENFRAKDYLPMLDLDS
jgi:hypothetical protein